MSKITVETAQRACALLIRAGVPFECKRATNGGCWILPLGAQSAASIGRAIELAKSAQALEAQPLELH